MHAMGANLSPSVTLMTSRSYPPTAADGICMSFHYHMYGANVGKLSVSAMFDGSDGSQQTTQVSLLSTNMPRERSNVT